MFSREVHQHCRLLGNLRSDESLPDPFFNWFAYGNLGAVAFGLNVVGVERQHHAHGKMVAA